MGTLNLCAVEGGTLRRPREAGRAPEHHLPQRHAGLSVGFMDYGHLSLPSIVKLLGRTDT